MARRTSRRQHDWTRALAVFALLLQALLAGYMGTGGALAAKTASRPAAQHVHGTAGGAASLDEALAAERHVHGAAPADGALVAEAAGHSAAQHVHGSAGGAMSPGGACCQDCMACGTAAMATPLSAAPEPTALPVKVGAFADTSTALSPTVTAGHQARGPPLAA
jgi:hypothetical protein